MKQRSSCVTCVDIPHSLVIVLWEDSRFLYAGWVTEDSVQEDAAKPVPIISVGFLVADEKDYVVLAGGVDLDHEGHKVSGTMKIPRSQIKDVTKLVISRSKCNKKRK